jgi:hypothetical protein
VLIPITIFEEPDLLKGKDLTKTNKFIEDTKGEGFPKR